jgi:hypothetical protein
MAAARAQQLMTMDAAALAAELRALSDAGGSYDEQAACCRLLSMASPLPTGIAAEHCVRAVVSALTRGVQHAVLQTAGCIALAKLARAASATDATGAAGIRAVLAALSAHPADAGVQGAACHALMVLVSWDETNRTTAYATGGLVAVVAALARHPTDAAVATYGCHALGEMIEDHPQPAAVARDAGAATAVLAAMEAFPADFQVQSAGCFALYCILSALGTWFGGARADIAAAETILAAMRAHAGERTLQCCGGKVLFRLFQEDRNGIVAWVQLGAAALTVVTAALRTHQHDDDVLNVCCGGIARLMLSTEANKHAVGIGDAIEAVVAALCAFPAVVGMQQAGLPALAGMCQRVRDDQLAAAAAGALEVTILAMRTHVSNVHVQEVGCIALAALVVEVPPNQTRAGALGGVEATAAALRACTAPRLQAAAFFQRWGGAMASLLQDHPINKRKAVAAGAIELLVAHFRAVPGDAGSADLQLACFVMHHLIEGTDHQARAVLAGVMEVMEALIGESAGTTAHMGLVGLMQRLTPAAERHDVARCAVAGCKRCEAARDCGAMCALAGCGARGRDGGAKKLLRCGTYRAAATAARRTSARTGAATRPSAARRRATTPRRLLAPAGAERDSAVCCC